MKMPNYSTLSAVSLKHVKISLIHFKDSNDYAVLSEYDWGQEVAVRKHFKSAESLYNKLIQEA